MAHLIWERAIIAALGYELSGVQPIRVKRHNKLINIVQSVRFFLE